MNLMGCKTYSSIPYNHKQRNKKWAFDVLHKDVRIDTDRTKLLKSYLTIQCLFSIFLEQSCSIWHFQKFKKNFLYGIFPKDKTNISVALYCVFSNILSSK